MSGLSQNQGIALIRDSNIKHNNMLRKEKEKIVLHKKDLTK